ncbi:hypothetical protein Tco_1165321 [Tanacetum coccineum]
MHIWCGRRSVSRPRSQHARNQSLSRKSRSGDEAAITPDIERSVKPKWKAVYSGSANGNRTKTQRRANNVSLRSQRSSKRNPINGKGLATSISLFRQPRLASPRNKLQCNGKTGFSTGTCYKKAEEILSGTLGGEAFDITYRPKTSMRGQILADFIAERPDEEGPPMEAPAEEAIPELWTLFMDESLCLEGSRDGLILTSPEGEEFTYALRFEFDASNNEAEYEALIDRNNA